MAWNRLPRYTLLTLGYAALVQLACLLALALQFDGAIPAREWAALVDLAPAFMVLSLAGFLIAGLFHGLWRYAGTVTLFQIFKGVTLSALSLLVLLVAGPRTPFTGSFVPLVWLCEMALVSGARLGWRLWRERTIGSSDGGTAAGAALARALIVGAGPAAVHLVQEARRGPVAQRRFAVVGFLDEDPRLTGKQIEGVKVLGTLARLGQVLDEFGVEVVVIATPDPPSALVREVARVCDPARVRVKTLAGLTDAEPGRAALARLRDMRLEDLLGRRPVRLDSTALGSFLHGQRVLVTGAGGTIGAELARQAAGFAPAALGLLDHAENGVYYVQHDLAAHHADLSLDVIIADIQDAAGIEAAFRRFRPTLVLHSAAHKHVPLLEANPREAVLNNVIGTLRLVEAAERHGVGKFVLISTDKAVRPASVMGATKRVCEMLLQSRPDGGRTRFVAVRFGNVLGSEGSVIPLFQRQLERGGPLTVTHPEARRYFMTVSEAARLVLQAGAMGRGGEVFLLDMGEQVRILDLARQLIRMAGLTEGVDVRIEFTGLRPGEKLAEELHSVSERARATQQERILIWEQAPVDHQRLLAQVAELEAVAREGNGAAIRQHLRRLVPEYQELPVGVAAVPAPDASPLVELPVSARVAPRTAPGPAATATARPGAQPPRPARRRRRPGRLRPLTDGMIAAGVLALSAPLWPLVWLESRITRRGPWLEQRVCVGRSRRGGSRRDRSTPAALVGVAGPAPLPLARGDDRRALDLMGEPVRSVRFRAEGGPLARWLARRGLDRLPELINVVRGDMALVGPSPVPRAIVTLWTELVPTVGQRFSVLPGVTGPAQLSGDSDDDVGALVRRAALDLDYIERRSAWLDFSILARALGQVLVPPPAVTRPAPVGRPASAAARTGAVRRVLPRRRPRAGG